MSEIILDLETTGVKPSLHHRVLSIGAIRIDDKYDIMEKFYTEMRPVGRCVYDPKALEINGFTREQISALPNSCAAMKSFTEWLAEDWVTMIGWNVQFDWRFLDQEYDLLSMPTPFSFKICDLHSIMYDWTGTSHTLSSARAYFGLEDNRGVHNALEDAEITLELYRKIKGV